MDLQEFGAMLRERREQAGVSLAALSEKTRIHPRFLRAIEFGDIGVMPGEVYARAFVKHYANALGMDAREVSAQYEAALAAAGWPGRRPCRPKRRPVARRRAAWRPALQWIVLVVLLLVAGVVIAQFLASRDAAAPGAEAPAGFSADPLAAIREMVAGAGDAPAPDATLSEPQADPGAGEVGGGQGVIAAGEDAGDAANASASPDVAVAAEGDEGTQGEATGTMLASTGAAPASAGAMPSADTAGEDGGEVPAASRPDDGLEAAADDAGPVDAALEAFAVVLDVRVLRTCWFEVVADGEIIFTGILDPGAEMRWTAREALRVRYGHPEGVRITLNGQYLGAPGTGVITRTYTASGMAPL